MPGPQASLTHPTGVSPWHRHWPPHSAGSQMNHWYLRSSSTRRSSSGQGLPPPAKVSKGAHIIAWFPSGKDCLSTAARTTSSGKHTLTPWASATAALLGLHSFRCPSLVQQGTGPPPSQLEGFHAPHRLQLDCPRLAGPAL